MATPESIVMKEVRRVLQSLEASGDCFYWERLNSGVFTVGDAFIQGCRKGTFDFICIFPDKQKNLSVLFIECKRSDKKMDLSESQKEFKSKYSKHTNIRFIMVQSGKELSKEFFKHAYNRILDVEL